MGFFNRIWMKRQLPAIRSQHPRFSIALGGGGARGAAHLGVMQRLSEDRLDVQRIVGVSMGAMVGAMCAVDSDVRAVQRRAIQMLRSPAFIAKQQTLGAAAHKPGQHTDVGLFSWYEKIKRYVAVHRKYSRVVNGSALLDSDLLRQAINALVPDIDISQTQVPLSIVAVDLYSGMKVVLENGSLRTAVEASMAIPGIFPPVPYCGMLLCDVGAIDSLPIDVARSYRHDLSIAVDVSQAPTAIDHCHNALDVMVRMEEIGERLMRRKVLPEADVVIRPELHRIAWFDFHRVESLIDAGYRAADEALRELGPGKLASRRRLVG